MAGVDVLLGLQWGDEGKGKIVDYLAPNYEIVARFQGGPNAGHTLEFDGHKHVLHQIPSGIFHENILNVIGNGVVLDPRIFKQEIEKLAPFNLDVFGKLILSNKAQMILPTHKLLDNAYEQEKGEKKIGSTLRGIGPTYQDKAARRGLRVGDVLEPDFTDRYDAIRDYHLNLLSRYEMEIDLKAQEEEFFTAIEFLKKFKITSTEYVLNHALAEGKNILAEGAQGSMLDIDFGSYPFVTSSNTITAGACTGLGIAPHRIREVFGIFKAYCTRVGSGPFPTELLNEQGERLRTLGNEFGATTGRPRRCGWLDLPALKYSCMLNGVTKLFMMKADVLSKMEEVKVCYAYKLGSEVTSQLPLYLDKDNWELQFKTFPCWQASQARTFEELPAELNNYISFIEKEVGAPVEIVSLGPNRLETVIKAEMA